ERERARVDRPPVRHLLARLSLAGDDHLTADLEPDVSMRTEVVRRLVELELRIDPTLLRDLDLEGPTRHPSTLGLAAKRSKTPAGRVPALGGRGPPGPRVRCRRRRPSLPWGYRGFAGSCPEKEGAYEYWCSDGSGQVRLARPWIVGPSHCDKVLRGL